MLQVNKASPPASDDAVGLTPSQLIKMFNSFKLILKRQFRVFLVLMACTTALGLLYLFITPPSYTASGTMVIDSHRVQMLQEKPDQRAIAIDAGTVQTEVEVLLSRTISLSVIKELRLTEDPEFAGNGGLLSFVHKLVPNFWRPSGIDPKAQLTDRALAAFERRRTVVRIAPAYVIGISFRSLDPVKSARIVNAIADAYVTEQLDSKYQATRRASAWLEDRIKELRMQASVADRAVVDFKRANNIVTVEDAHGGNARLMNEQQLSELNSQLVLARAATAEA
ncbi:MAG: GumC family protein, partial [Blastocatellia bacterium]